MTRENEEAVWVAAARRAIYFPGCPEAQAKGPAQARLLTRVGPPGNRVLGGEGQPNPPADRLGDRSDLEEEPRLREINGDLPKGGSPPDAASAVTGRHGEFRLEVAGSKRTWWLRLPAREEPPRVESGNRRGPDRSDIVASLENPERARLRSSFLGVLRVERHLEGRRIGLAVLAAFGCRCARPRASLVGLRCGRLRLACGNPRDGRWPIAVNLPIRASRGTHVASAGRHALEQVDGPGGACRVEFPRQVW